MNKCVCFFHTQNIFDIGYFKKIGKVIKNKLQKIFVNNHYYTLLAYVSKRYLNIINGC